MVTGGNGRMKNLIRIAVVTLSLIFIAMATVLFVVFYPFTPIKYFETALKQNAVMAGGQIEYTSFFEKYVNTVGTVTTFLVSMDGKATIVLTSSGLADAKPDDTFKVVQVDIPENTKPGKYKIRWVVVYDYYGIRQVRVRCETPEFTVIK